MRIRTNKKPHPKAEIKRWVRKGPPAPEPNKKEDPLVHRLRQSCYLDCNNKPLDAFGRLLAQYKKDGLVLFLGAGISSCSGIPNWPRLIERLVDKLLPGIDYATVKWAFPTLISQFDLVAYQLNDPQKFYRAVYSALYGDPKFKDVQNIAKDIPKEKTKWNRWQELLNGLKKNKTLEAVADLLIIDSENSHRRNPQIHAVLTTNADNLLELYCQARTSGERLLTMVDRASVGDHPEATPVYHLHGTLDARGENLIRAPEPCSEVAPTDRQEIDEQLLPSLVFRESEYFETLAAPTNFVNHTPQSYFQRLNVLFIGTSLDDPNIRRWLYTSFRERVKERTKYLQEYYCRKYKDAGFEAELESVRHFWLRPTKEMHRDCSSGKESERKVPMELVECAMRKLGVQVVWCDGFRDVCAHLVRLKKEGHEPNFGRRSPKCND